MEEKQGNAKEETNILRETYTERWQTYRSELKRCQAELTEEAVHDLRVATRRLLALIDLLRTITPHPRLQKLRRTLKNQLNEFNELRDTQVMQVEVSAAMETFPELKPFQEFLDKREQRLMRSTAKAIQSFKYSRVKKRMGTVRKKILKQKPDKALGSLLLQAVDAHFEKIMRRYQRIDPETPASIHRMRVAFKNFRYMLEIVHPLMPGYPQENLKLMHAFQSRMGDIQDTEVLLSAYEGFAKREASFDPEAVLRYYQERHKESINLFMEDMHNVNNFWRTKPDSPFPWEAE